jgi:hypothetical protein
MYHPDPLESDDGPRCAECDQVLLEPPTTIRRQQRGQTFYVGICRDCDEALYPQEDDSVELLIDIARDVA